MDHVAEAQGEVVEAAGLQLAHLALMSVLCSAIVWHLFVCCSLCICCLLCMCMLCVCLCI